MSIRMLNHCHNLYLAMNLERMMIPDYGEVLHASELHRIGR